MATEVNVIGSKWAGQDNDTVEQLLALMACEPLDPRFEKYGNFLYLIHEFNGDTPHLYNGYMRIWGNFFVTSYVFDILTTDADLIHRFAQAITLNQLSPAYRAAKAERKARA